MVQGLWLLLHLQYWTLTETFVGYPAIAPSHGGPAAIVSQDWSLHVLQQVSSPGPLHSAQLSYTDATNEATTIQLARGRGSFPTYSGWQILKVL